MNRQRQSVRSRGSSSSTGSRYPQNNARRRCKDWCRKLVAFMCTQVGVGGLIVGYAVIGAFSFISIETKNPNNQHALIERLRIDCAAELWKLTIKHNLFNSTQWYNETNHVLLEYQTNLTAQIKMGYDGRTPSEIWTIPAALMFCLSVFTMIGYGNMVPRTPWGKGATVIYATFGIPLYVLYFLNMGKAFAQLFKYIYTTIHECCGSGDENSNGGGSDIDLNDYRMELGSVKQHRKKIIVPSRACLWVISFYILTGTIMFANWEQWNYLDSVYFCVTSLCKIGMGDFVPGAHIMDTHTLKNTKLAINFVYMLLGMGIVAMCYNLMREDVKVKMQEMKEDMRLCLDDVRSRFGICFGEKDQRHHSHTHNNIQQQNFYK